MTSRANRTDRQKQRSVDALWTTLCQTVGDEVAHIATNSEKKSGSECSYCHDLNSCNGLLLRCTHPRGCNKFVHPTCAYDIGSLTQPEGQEGEELPVLVARCEEHVRKLTYCICKSTYEEGAALIGCDSCKDWFHFTCLGLDPYQEYDDFICDNCKGNSSSLIKELKLRNERKDELHEANERAENGVKMICTFGDDVCPIVDSLNASKKVSPTDIDKALNTISAFEEDRYFDYESIQTKFGIYNIISSWKSLLMDVNKHIKQLGKRIKEAGKALVNYTVAFRVASIESLILNKSYREMKRELHRIRCEWDNIQTEIANCAVREFDNDPFQKSMLKTFEYLDSYFITIEETPDISSDEALASMFKKVEEFIEEGHVLLRKHFLYSESSNTDLEKSVSDLVDKPFPKR